MAYVKPISYWKTRRNVQFQLKHHPYLKIDKSKVPKQIQEPSNLDIPVTNTALNFTSSPTVSQTGHDNVRLSTRPSESKHLFNNTLNNPGVTHRPSSNSESEFEELSPCSSSQSDVDEMSLSDQLGEWATSNNISQTAVSSLLNILKPYHIDLPKDPRSLLKPIKDISFENIAGGKYYHFGIANYIKSKMQLSQPCKESISIKINIDGLPLFRSSNMQFWPILGITDQIFDSTPFPIGIFSGMSKPSPVNEFLKPLIDEVTSLEEHGIEHCGAKYQFSISAVICDAPARALIKRVKGHSSYKGCDRCIQTGTWMGKMVYKESADSLRTDESFQQMLDEDHHLEQSPFSSTSIGLVSQFPLDYMHLVCLGVTRKLLGLWMKGPLKTRMPTRVINAISEKMISLREFMPREFSRKPRSLREVDRWKATEFRQFLVYTGPLVLSSQIPVNLYHNFMLLSVAVQILLSPRLCNQSSLIDYSEELLKLFVAHFSKLYGKEMVVYNVHCLLHLADDARKYGPLDNVSAFPFESYLGTLKKMVKKPSLPLRQVVGHLLRKGEIQKSMKNNECTILKQEHSNGPVPEGHLAMSQYAYFYHKDLNVHITLCTGDNCVQIGNDVCLVQNFFVTNDDLYVVYRSFTHKENYFSYPCESKCIGILQVDSISENLQVSHSREIFKKYVLLPHRNWFIAMPILH